MKTKSVRFLVEYEDTCRWKSFNAVFRTLNRARKHVKENDIEICGKRDKFRIVKRTTISEVVE